MTAKALREERAKLATTIRQMADKVNAEGRDFNAEEQPQWEKVNADYNTLTRRIEVAERADSVGAEQRAPAHPENARVGHGDHDGRNVQLLDTDAATPAHLEELRAMALQAWCRVQMDEDPTEEQLEACRAVKLNPNSRKLNVQLYRTADYRSLQRRFRQAHPSQAVDHCQDFRAAMSMGSGPAGGYLVAPETLIRNLEINMLAFGGVRQVAETMRTASGERMSWPTADDTTNTGAQLGENTSIGASTDPTFGKVYWDAYKFSSKPVLVPYELLEDSAFDLLNVLGQMLGERLGRITNTKYTTGTGAATPKGIVTGSTAFSAASATAIAYDDILGLEHAVDPAYRIGAGYMLHDSILLVLRKLKDGNGLPLWQSNIQMGVPDRLHGYPLTNNQDMDSTVASGKKTLLFGQLSKYKIRAVGGVRLYRLQERYRDTDQDGFIALIREDGNLLTAGTAPVKHLAH